VFPAVDDELKDGRAGQRRTVLLVDDCRDTRELYAEYLELSGYCVKEASDGMTALSEAARVLPDVIVLDMSMPGLDGEQAVRRLRAEERTRDIPIVMVSGYEPDWIGDAGWDEFIAKPCDPERLISVIKALVAR
jgi:two-component system cell cycle response regulator DivK